MIYKEKKFIFIHIPKTGGVSINKALYPFQDSVPFSYKFYNKFLSLKKRKIYPKYLMLPMHTKANDYKIFLGNEYYDYFTFAISRNPFDWHVSLYEFIRSKKEHRYHNMVVDMNFDNFVNWKINNELVLQKNFVVGDDGQLIVDYVGKLENIENDFKKIIQKIGITTTLPHLNKTIHEKYENYFDKKLINTVIEAYEQDFNFFNYKKRLHQ